MRVLSFILLALALTSVIATPSKQHHHHQHAHHAWGSHKSWTADHKTAADKHITLTFAVPRVNTHIIEKSLLATSDPKNKAYGAHLTHEQVETLTIDNFAMKQVEKALKKAGAHKITRQSSFIKATLSVKDVESFLSTEIHTYVPTHTTKNQHAAIHRAKKYTIPAELKKHIEFVMPLTHFPKAHSLALPLRKPLADGNTVPATLITAYNIPNTTSSNPASTQGCFEDGQSIDPNDISSFQTTYNLQQQKAIVVGPNSPFCAFNPNGCIEATLDIEYIMAIAQGAPTTFWAIDASDQSPFLDWLIALAASPTAPLVNSVSYGEVEPNVDPTVRSRFETEAQTLGARGITIIIASGDDGVANFPARTDPNQCGFFPSYPASSPYVTAVGATQGPEAGTTEIAESSSTGGLITTGGGFSTVWNQPTWQQTAVQKYLNSAQLPSAGSFNNTGRGYPDVAVLGHNYIITVGGNQAIVSGTSASAPVFAALVTLVNSQRLSAGKSSLGFLNPALYQVYAQDPTIFNDITSGENNCPAAQSNPTCCAQGFYAAAGWDPLTGLGSPNFAKLQAALAAL